MEFPVTNEELRAAIEHIFRVLYADEEVGPVLVRRHYQIDAALERSRKGFPEDNN